VDLLAVMLNLRISLISSLSTKFTLMAGTTTTELSCRRAVALPSFLLFIILKFLLSPHTSSLANTSQSPNHTSVVAMSNNDYSTAPGYIAAPGHVAASNYLAALAAEVTPAYIAAAHAADIKHRDAQIKMDAEVALADAQALAIALPLPSNMHFDKGEAVTLIVGEEKHQMLVHACHISKNSEFFRTALKKEWLEGQTRIITLPVDDPKTVTHYLNFTYSGELPSEPLEAGCKETRVRHVHEHLANLYTLGVRLLDNVVRTAVIKRFLQIHDIAEDFPDQHAVDIIYQGTSDEDPARRLMVHMYLSRAGRDTLKRESDPGFLFDVAQALFYEEAFDEYFDLHPESYEI
jgi:hypothetical protein